MGNPLEINEELNQFDYLKEISKDLDYFSKERQNILDLSSIYIYICC